VKIINVDKTECVAKVQIELDAEELSALWQAVRDNDLYESWWNASMQSNLFAGLQDAIDAMRVVPNGHKSKVVDVVKPNLADVLEHYKQ
jgi:hypothetical protein